MFNRAIYPFINTNSLMIGLISIIFYHIPYIVLGENTLYNIGDVLDSSIVFYTIINNLDHFFSFSNDLFIHSFLGESVPRNALPSSFNITSWIFFFLRPSVAYPLSRFLVSIVGLLGMYYFLTEHIIKKDNYKLFSVIISLAFAILPHKPIMGGAIFAIAPVLFFSFFNLIKLKRKKLSILLCFIMPFFSSAVMSTSFIWITLLSFWIYLCIKRKSFQIYPFLGLMIMFTSMLLADIHLVLITFMNDSFISHRVDRIVGSYSLIEVISNAWHIFLSEKKFPLATIHHSIFYWFFAVVFMGLLKGKEYIIKPVVFAGCIFINCVLAVIIKWDYLDFIKDKYEIFSTFDFERILNLNAFYWWVLLAMIINEIFKLLNRKNNYIFLLIIILSISGPFYVIRNSWGYRENCKRFIYNIKTHNQPNNMMTMNQFYSTPLFNEIKEWIGKDEATYRVGSLGLHPGVPAFNGFYTIDGYSNFYSLDYKIRFREIIQPELEKNPSQLNKFDKWGNRCYLFSSELLRVWNHKDYIIPKNSNLVINKLDFNFYKLKELGCEYIISTVEINKVRNPNLVFQKKFEHANLPYSIYLYNINIL